MEPLSALGLASSIIQIVDFAGRLLSKSREIYTSAEGTIQEHSFIEESASNLAELSAALSTPLSTELERQRIAEKATTAELKRQRSALEATTTELKKQRGASNATTAELERQLSESKATIAELERQRSAEKPTTADRQLVQLCKNCKDVATELLAEIDRLKLKGPHGRLKSVQQALRHEGSQSQIFSLQQRLDNLRSQVDTVLLVSLSHRIGRPHGSHVTNNGRYHPTRTKSKEDLSVDTESWKLDLLAALKEHDWNAEKGQDVADFSKQLHSAIEVDIETRFCQLMLARLYFADLSDRIRHIPEAHQKTFKWLFDDNVLMDDVPPWDSFTDWLQSSEDLYWITGKPGSGKSTLMKFLFHDPRSSALLDHWSGGQEITKAGFFFWNSGTAMQMSRLGLFQSLLHQMLSGNKSLILKLFRHRWDQFISFGGGRHPFNWTELRFAFENALTEDIRFFFVIDGLDEFDGDHYELVTLILDAAKRSNVKICAASRPWVVFEDAFQSRPSLLLEKLTRDDIHLYVKSKFEEDKSYARLMRREPRNAAQLVDNVVDKAVGVFLWVYLVVKSLIEGLSHADRMSDLQARLDALPPDLESLFDKLLNQIDHLYFKHACQLFRLILTHEQPLLFALSFADEEDPDMAMKAAIRPLTQVEIQDRSDETERRVVAHCKCFLDVDDDWGNSNKTAYGLQVRLIHRTARDFLQSRPIWNTILDATGHDKFDPDERWASAYLAVLKFSNPLSMFFGDDVWDTFTWCLEYALRLEKKRGAVQLEYLDEVGRASMRIRQQFQSATNIPLDDPFHTYEDSVILSFLTMAAYFNMDQYVRIRAKQATPKELKNAESSAKMRIQRDVSFPTRKTALEACREEGKSKTKAALDQGWQACKAAEKENAKKKRRKFLHSVFSRK